MSPIAPGRKRSEWWAVAFSNSALAQARGSENRSEAIRDLVRHELGQETVLARPDAPCVGHLHLVPIEA